MALPISITYTFATATGPIPLSQLDADFTLLSSTINGIGDGTTALATPNFSTNAKYSGSTSGYTILQASAVAGATTLTLPSATDTLVGKATTDTLTNKTINLASNTLTATSAQLASGISDETGSGSLVFATSPTLVTPLLGTPTSGTLTNCTGYTVGNISGLGTGVGTWLVTPSSANLSAAVTDETGTGLLTFATSPTLTTPKIAQINDTNSNATLKLLPIASAVNQISIENSATLNPPHIYATGTDANIGLHLSAKGTGAYVNVQDATDATKRIAFNPSGATTATYTILASIQTVNRTVTLPDATDTLVGKATTDILTNKSISGATNTLTAIPLTTAVTGTLPTANGGTNLGGATPFTLNGALYATSTSVLTSGTLPVTAGGTGASTASITSFNNITGYTASGATGTTSTNLVFSTSPTLTTPNIGAATGTSVVLTGAISSSSASAGIGYATGAGEALTQLTSATTTVTSANKMTGTITLFSVARAAQTNSTFTFTNTSIGATDHVVITHISAGTLGAYNITATPAAGSATINVRNVNTASLTEAPVLKYTIIKSVVA
jgi:hypothetical protein